MFTPANVPPRVYSQVAAITEAYDTCKRVAPWSGNIYIQYDNKLTEVTCKNGRVIRDVIVMKDGTRVLIPYILANRK